MTPLVLASLVAAAMVVIPSSSTSAQVPAPSSGPASTPPAVTGDASAAAFAGCSAAYHAALEPLRMGRGASLGTLQRALRTADPALPGRWQFSAPPSGKQKPPPKPQRVCVATQEVRGRQPRCVRWETKQPLIPPDTVAKLAPTADEARVLKAIGDFIEAKGALPEVGPNGRQTPVLLRLTGELRQYIMQEAHPALCAGTSELMEFYEGQAAPLKKRGEDIAALSRQVKGLSEQRVRAIALAEQRVYDKAVTEAQKIEEQRAKLLAAHNAAVAKAQEAAAVASPAGSGTDQTSRPAPALPPAPTLPNLPSLPPKPNPPAKPEDYAVVGFASLVSEALRPLLPHAKGLEIADAKTPVMMLTLARTALLDPALASDGVAADVRDAALMALRMLEARAYGELYVARYKDLEVVLFGTFDDLRKAQTRTCTCQN